MTRVMGRDMGRNVPWKHGQRSGNSSMATRTLNRLSANLVKALAERGYYADGGGLYFRVSEFGTRLWAFRYTHDGRAREMALATSLRWHSNGEQWRTTLVTYADPVIGRLLVRDVQQAHILKILEPIWTTKTETASSHWHPMPKREKLRRVWPRLAAKSSPN